MRPISSADTPCSQPHPGLRWILAGLILLAGACTTPTPKPPSAAHLRSDDLPSNTGSPPPPVTQTLALPRPKPTPRAETYSVVVNNVKVHDLLFCT